MRFDEERHRLIVGDKENKIFPIGNMQQVELAVNKGRKMQVPTPYISFNDIIRYEDDYGRI